MQDAQNDTAPSVPVGQKQVFAQHALDRAADALHGGDTAGIVVVGTELDAGEAHFFKSKLEHQELAMLVQPRPLKRLPVPSIAEAGRPVDKVEVVKSSAKPTAK